MVTVRAIHRENDYRAAMIRIEALMNALSGPEGQVDDADDPRSIELDVLVDLVELYESKTVEIGFPTVIDAIEFNLDRLSLTRRDLVPLIGSRAKVSEVLSGKRPITMSMARALHRHLGIPADILLQDPGATLPDALPGLDWARFPLKSHGESRLDSESAGLGRPSRGDNHQPDRACRGQGSALGALPQKRPPAHQRQNR